MKLRDHPLICYDGVRNWPPMWTWIGGKENKYPTGEVGTLKELLVPTDESPSRCFLVMEYEGATYIGRLLLRDPSFCRDICRLLKNHYGDSIRSVGGLDLDYSF